MKKLTEVITSPNLGAIKIKNDIPSVDQIKDALTSGGKNPGLDTNAITFATPFATGITVIGTANEYTGSVDVSYTVEKLVMYKKLDSIAETTSTRILFFVNNKWYVGCSDAKIYRLDEDFTNQIEVIDLSPTDPWVTLSVGQMIFVNNKWYVGCSDLKIYRLDEDFTNQIEVVDFTLHHEFILTLTFFNNKFYVSCRFNRTIYSFDLDEKGKFINQEVVFVLNKKPKKIVFNNNKCYVCDHTGKIHRFDLDEKGKFINQIKVVDLKVNIQAMNFVNNKWYVGCRNGKIYCFDEDFGNKQVFSNLESGVICSLFEKNNQLCIMTKSKNIFEFNY